jgi:hypothetical protein
MEVISVLAKLAKQHRAVNLAARLRLLGERLALSLKVSL